MNGENLDSKGKNPAGNVFFFPFLNSELWNKEMRTEIGYHVKIVKAHRVLEVQQNIRELQLPKVLRVQQAPGNI